MRLFLVGKFPPIEGGVSMRTYWFAHEMAKRGHQVEVITNAVEVEANFRMVMQPEDWSRRSADYGRGYVRVHDTQPWGRNQRHIPDHNPFVTKLASIGIALGSEQKPDGVFSFYLEPYAVAGHLISQALGVPHIVKTAGSDVGRLRYLDQFGPLYDHIFRSVQFICVGNTVAKELVEAGIPAERMVSDPGFSLPDEWPSCGDDRLDPASLAIELEADPLLSPLVWGHHDASRPYFGIYGKLGRNKGSYAALDALALVLQTGRDVGLVFLGQGTERDIAAFEAHARSLKLEDRVLRLPFLPHWRIPSFIRGTQGILCLEQDFPIAIHSPIIAREVLACRGVLIASTEILAKMPSSEQMISDYNCIAVQDAKSAEAVADAMIRVMDDPPAARIIAASGHRVYERIASRLSTRPTLESVIEEALSGKLCTSEFDVIGAPLGGAGARPPFFRLAARGGTDSGIMASVPQWLGSIEISEPEAPDAAFTIVQQAPWRSGPRTLSLDPFTACVLSQCDGTMTGAAIARMMGGEDSNHGMVEVKVQNVIVDLLETALIEVVDA
ncbi:MAG: hypothetical protein K0Q70_1038 [Rhodospirillales bacterium]|jgi:glycosyltransferase involved in cell wall biosynthesis|nr:hypothetical protein [Rhodospirillales bacterium]